MKQSSKLTKDIIKYCLLSKHYVFRVNNIPGTKFRANTLTKGISDIQGCTGKKLKIDGKVYEAGTTLCIEIKVGNDKMSEHQVKFKEEIEKRGGIFILAKKLEDVTEVI